MCEKLAIPASDSLLAMFAGVTAGSPGGGVSGQQHSEEVTDYRQTPCHHAKGMYSYVTLCSIQLNRDTARLGGAGGDI